MIDELDLAFDEQIERGKPRHRRSGRGGKGKSTVAFLMVFLLLGVLGVGGYLGFEKVKGFFTAADYDGAGTGQVEVSLAEGSLTDIGNALVEKDVVKSTAAFIEAAEENPRGKNIQPGTYTMRLQMSAKDAVTLLLDPKARVTKGVTIPEGKTALEIYAILSKATGVPVKDFEAAAKDPKALGVPDFWFNRRDDKKASGTIEGFLFPDTYEFKPKSTAAEMLSVMVAKFIDTTTEMDFVKSVESGLSVSPYEALIVASLSQAEAGIAEDLPKVARVAYNRAYKKKMPLQFDVTTNYWLQLQNKGKKHSGKMTTAELEDPKNPYTTELKVGLPLGPINNPGKLALQGAEKPATGDWLFFVAVDKTGRSAFAVTNAEHDANIQKACQNGIPLC
ncbi:endolytic transglycosylase MltG [Couchioplanes azureus]|uniref:endolytic transglycosylase MltG n=1 Tax=Couchioplanes caeruleus TaxID=56438 RepID=UPI0016711CDB|nr:endolytic transglycosylase MltG [Couchioplanes caeruleus]GGQ53704.1 ABC transporter substrate-binding protein [Couchioplanes caeruleus subsp. azureus]